MHIDYVLYFCSLATMIPAQAPYYPNHWYGANSEQIKSKVVPDVLAEPIKNAGTLAPHFCGFNPFTRECMDPEHFCPGRCMNFQYIFNSRYDCRCLVV